MGLSEEQMGKYLSTLEKEKNFADTHIGPLR